MIITLHANLTSFELRKQAPVYLYKILTVAEWNTCFNQQKIILSSSDKPFIHLATEEQYPRIAEKYFFNVTEYVLLKVETRLLDGRLTLESNPSGTTKYYHLYNGSIPFKAVKESRIMTHAKEKAAP